MHDLEFEHLHVSPDDVAVNEVAWAADNVELTTVGIDIGSSTSHLMFARVHLQRLSTALSSRFVVVERKILWQSPILLTPYRPDYTIDVDDLAGFIGGCYAYAGVEREKVDSGAVILTGEALKRRNARAIADLFSEEAGKFVCASAGHHMECQMAAHGSGAVALSRGHNATLLNVDIGGGTTKFALIENGRILATCAIAVGGRLIVEDDAGGLTRIEAPAEQIAQALGIELALGAPFAPGDRQRVAARMARMVMGLIDLRQPGELARALLVTEPWPAELANRSIDAITFSGGAAQFSVQISGNTILIADPDKLPLQNLPVLSCNFAADGDITPDAVAAAVRGALTRADFEEGESPRALACGRGRHLRRAAADAGRGHAAGALDRRRRRQEPRPRHPPRDRPHGRRDRD